MSSEEAKGAGGGGNEASTLRLGCKVQGYRQLSSQIVTKDEIAEEINNRFSKSASDTTRPFVDKRVLQEALLALKFDEQFVRKIDPSNEEFLLAQEKKRANSEAAGAADEPRSRFGKRLDPKMEKELALKQLSELPTLKRRRKNQDVASPPEPPPAPSVFNEKVLQNLKRSVQRSARHSALVLKPEAVRTALERLGVPPPAAEGAAEPLTLSEELNPYRQSASRIIRRHSSSEDEDDSDPEDSHTSLAETGGTVATEAPAEATATEALSSEAAAPKDQCTNCKAEEDKLKIEVKEEPPSELSPNGPDVRVMRSRVQKTYPSKRRSAPSPGDDGRRTYLSPVMKKQLGRI
ncbi:uncharacterized protein LOC135942385 [Cloeon dipterum]|uniref:uncharacterized protein LOC135942385 n=1 Tax=Cloeon dipterum TaxID=197152 RepID=UPI00321F8EB7